MGTQHMEKLLVRQQRNINSHLLVACSELISGFQISILSNFFTSTLISLSFFFTGDYFAI